MKKAILISVLLIFPFCSLAEITASGSNCGEDCSWKIEDGVLTVSGSGDMANFTSDDKPWATYRSSITNFVVEDGITSIASSAVGWTNVSNVTLPNSIETIGSNAFAGTNQLTSLVIPDSVTSIGSQAFWGSAITSLVIPQSVEIIGSYAFRDMRHIRELTIPDSIQTLGNNAFADVKIENGEITDILVNNGIQNLTISANMLSKYLEAKGGFAEGANINCTSGDCSGVLSAWDAQKGTNYANSTNIAAQNTDGSTTLYKNGNVVGYKGKRIYTLEEANIAAGKKNIIKIRYK